LFNFLEERASEPGKEEGGVVDDEGVSAGVSGELEDGTASVEGELLARETFEDFVGRVGAGAATATGWVRF